jgi:hypothetical protein
MTLLVTTFRVDPKTGGYTEDPLPEESGWHMAGFEAWRTLVWGSEAAKKRGARFLPQLAEGNLSVYPEDLPAFAEECRRLLEDVEAFAHEVGMSSEVVAWRLQNFLRAVERAAPEVGGVCID